ncbi:MAG: ROK family protein [Chloroflexi bacterium]|nr:ROK family protein [Chloroflexota bacterium]
MARSQTHDDPLIPHPGTRLKGLGLGIDVGGTGVKAALVDLATGTLASDRVREKTPQPATPEAVTATVASVVAQVLDGETVPDDLPVGCGLPGVVTEGILRTAANIDKSWEGVSVEGIVGEALGRRVLAINDADAAGLAELAYGAAEGVSGTVLLLTIGTGIGSALFIDGRLVPNTEFGHLEFHGKDAELRVSGAARSRRGLGWKSWAREFDEYLDRLELYFWPDLIILGGGVSKDMAKYEHLLTTRAPVKAAELLNVAGIVGAAYAGAASLGVAKAKPKATARRPRKSAAASAKRS